MERKRGYRKKHTWRGEIITHKKSGKKLPALISISTLKDTLGNVTGTVAVIRDVLKKNTG